MRDERSTAMSAEETEIIRKKDATVEEYERYKALIMRDDEMRKLRGEDDNRK